LVFKVIGLEIQMNIFKFQKYLIHFKNTLLLGVTIEGLFLLTGIKDQVE